MWYENEIVKDLFGWFSELSVRDVSELCFDISVIVIQRCILEDVRYCFCLELCRVILSNGYPQLIPGTHDLSEYK